MTTIAWDGTTVAADSAATYHDHIRTAKGATKLRRNGNTVYACVGWGALFEPLIKWYEAGAKPEDMFNVGDECDTYLLVFKKGRGFLYRTAMPYPDEVFPPVAWGSGANIALGAMLHKASAKEAVEIACNACVFTGGEVINMRTGKK